MEAELILSGPAASGKSFLANCMSKLFRCDRVLNTSAFNFIERYKNDEEDFSMFLILYDLMIFEESTVEEIQYINLILSNIELINPWTDEPFQIEYFPSIIYCTKEIIDQCDFNKSIRVINTQYSQSETTITSQKL